MGTQELLADRTPTEQRQRSRPRIKNTSLWFWVFVGPFFIGLLIFSYIPIGWSLLLSFFRSQNTVSPVDFVGLDNYLEMLQDGPFRDSLITFTVYAAFIIPLTFALSLGLALLVNQVRIARAFFRSAFFIPTACSYVVASLIWSMSIFNGVRFGLANQVLGLFGVDEDVAWLSTVDPPYYWIPLVTVRLWLQAGFFMILFIAGLQRISPDLYEAAYVDGAKPGWQTFRYVTFPQLRATSVAVLILLLIHAYQAFDEFYNLMGTGNIARPPLVYLYNTALTNQDYGRGSAGALILSVVIIAFTLLQGRMFGFRKTD